MQGEPTDEGFRAGVVLAEDGVSRSDEVAKLLVDNGFDVGGVDRLHRSTATVGDDVRSGLDRLRLPAADTRAAPTGALIAYLCTPAARR